MFACFYIPDFPVQAALLPEPAEARATLRQSPLAILDGPANLPRVFATNVPARRAGIQIGMTKLQVETYGGVRLRPRSLADEDSAQTALVNFAGKFSPRVESTCPGAVILDLAGTEKLLALRQNGLCENNSRAQTPRNQPPQTKFSSQEDFWQNAARAITTQAAEIGFDLRVAIAANPDTAFLAARGFSAQHFSPAIVIPAGEEAQRLASLPVDALPISPEMLEILKGWGILTFRALAALPTVAIVERLGQEGLYLQKFARGNVNRPLLTTTPDAEFIAAFEFDDPVETLESLFFVLHRLLHELCAKLLAAALAAQELRLTIGLEVRQIRSGNKEDEQYRHEWKLPVPTQDKNLLFGLLRLQLENTTLSAPIRRLLLEVVPVRPRVAQGNLFAPPSPEAEKLEITLERIRGVVGTADPSGIACVGSPGLVDTHKPGSFTVHNFSSDQNEERQCHREEERQCHPERSRLIREANQPEESKDLYSSRKSTEFTRVVALRMFRPVLETSVELDGEKPHFVRLWHRHRRVLAASGPWSTSGNWWSESAWTREEWDVALKTPAGLGFYRIFRDPIRQQWFVEGVFD